jgi:hypothetical protein
MRQVVRRAGARVLARTTTLRYAGARIGIQSETGVFMKRILLASLVLLSTLSVAHAQTGTYQFGEGQTQPQGAAQPAPLPGATESAPLPQGAAPVSRPAPKRVHAARHKHRKHVVAKKRHVRHVRPAHGRAYRHA